ncbi:MAG TPA: hypothetical protein VIJ94_19010 [Caulobacteraceae bacterium]
MKRIWGPAALAVVAIGLGACVREGPHAPRAAAEACASPKALLAVRRAAFQQAAAQGAPAELLAGLRRDGRVVLEDPQVGDYDKDTGLVSCQATLRIEPAGSEGQALSSSVTYDARPQGGGVYRYRLTDPGEMVTAIVSLGPPPPPQIAPPAASSAAVDAAATASAAPAQDDPTVRDDAAAAGDTGRVHRAPAAASPPAPPR